MGISSSVRHASSLTFPPYRLDLDSGTLWHADRPRRQLRPQVVTLVHYLFTHAGRVVSKQELHLQAGLDRPKLRDSSA